MTLDRWIAIWTAFALLAFPALSRADHHQAGEVAEEHRSDKAAEKSNAQWDEDNEGRPEKVRKDDDEGDKDDDKGRKDKKGKKDKKDKKGEKHKKGEQDKSENEDDHEDDHEGGGE